MRERRQSARRRSYLGGVLAFNRRIPNMECLVRNFSPAGAKLEFANSVTLPEIFDLTIRQKQRSLRARLCWQSATEVGVVFLDLQSAAVPLYRPPRLRACQAEDAFL
jgi:hypothetical protein